MSALSIQPTYPIFTDIDGQPLEAGYVWLGTANLDPQTNPITVYWDAALTILAPQPIRTLAGYPSNNGTPGRLYVDSDYSIRVMNKNGSTVYSAPDATERYSDVVISMNAANVVYDPAGVGAVPTTVQNKLRETVSVKDFGAVGDGVADDTVAIQAAIDFAVGLQLVVFPAGNYLVTDTLQLYKGSQLQGINQYQGFDDFSPGAVGTKITFQPTTLKNLFELQNLPSPAQTFRSKVAIKGFWIFGDGGVNCRAAIAFEDSIYNTFENLNIRGFQYGFFHTGVPINNRYVNIIVQRMSVECVRYDGSVSTTDVWEQCTFNRSPKGIVLKNQCIGIRFITCLFEELDIYGVEIDKEGQSNEFVACYSENVPLIADDDHSMFRVGYTGTTPGVVTILKVVGGNWAGKNGVPIGSFVDVDDAVGVQIVGAYVREYSRLARVTDNTANFAVEFTGVQFNSVVTVSTNTNKICGMFRTQAINAATGPSIRLAAATVTGDTTTASITMRNGPQIFADGGSPEGVYTAGPGSIFLRNNGGAGTSFYVKESGTGNTGWVAK